jgi:RHS repeat-associated protein
MGRRFVSRFHGNGRGQDEAAFTVGGVGQPAAFVVSKLFNPAGELVDLCNVGPCLEVRIETAAGEIVYQNDRGSTSERVTLAPGADYRLIAATLGEPFECNGCTVEAQVFWQEAGSVGPRVAGGLRIRQISDHDGLSPNRDRVRVFEYTDGANGGVLSSEPRYHFGHGAGDCRYVSRSSMPVVGPGMTNGSHIGYPVVVVKYGGASAPGGRTEHIFTSPRTHADFPERDPSFWPFAARTSLDYARGFERETSTYNGAGASPLQRLVRNDRFDANDESSCGDASVCKRYRALTVKASMANAQGRSDIFFRPYHVISAWLHPDRETVTSYDQNGANPISTVRSFGYGNRDHLQLTKTTETNSDGTERITESRYANERYAAMKNKNMLTQVYSTTVKKGEANVESKNWTLFTSFGDNWRPDATWAWVGDGSTDDTTANDAPDSEAVVVTDFVAYDEFGRVTEQQDARLTTTVLSYGGPNSAFLTGVSRETLTTTYQYHPVYNQVIEINEHGFKKHFDYDAFGRLSLVQNHAKEDLARIAYTYGLPSSVKTVTYLAGSPEKTITNIQYVDGLGRPIQGAVENGDHDVITATEYDRFGRVVKNLKPYFSPATNYDPDYLANAIAAYPKAGIRPFVETTYLPDPLNRVDKSLGVGDFRFGVNRDYFNDTANGLQYVLTVDEEGKRKFAYTDNFGNVVKTVEGIAFTYFTFDVLGNRTKVTDPLNVATTYRYDPLGRLLEKTSAESGTVRHKYDKNGNLRFSQDAQQAREGKVSFTLYDVHNRPEKTGEAFADFSAADPESVNAFEGEGTWLSVHQYDTKPSTTTFPWRLFATDIRATSMGNLNGRVAASAQKSGGAWQVLLYSYYLDGFVVEKHVFSEGLGQTKTRLIYVRDRQGNPTVLITQVGGQRLPPPFPPGLFGAKTFVQFYDYDARGLLEKVSTGTTGAKPATADVTFGDFTPGGLKGNVQFAGKTIPYTYTIRDWVETIDNLSSPAASFAANYVYNRNGTLWTAEFNQASLTIGTKQYKYTFAYDAMNRLTSAQSNLGNSFKETAWYNNAGNVTSLGRWREDGNPVDQLTYVYDQNRLVEIRDATAPTPESWDAENATFGYDLNGNMTSAGAPYNVSNILYNPQHLPEQMTQGDSTLSYRYDAAGQRYYKKVGAQSAEHYVMDGDVTMAVFDANGTLKHWNIVASGRVVGRRDVNGAKFFYVRDNVGSTRAVVNGAGQVVETSDYFPFGLALPGRGLAATPPTREKFTGKERDPETALDYFGARYYMPVLGRWMAVDPSADDYPGVTPYNYVLNNPLTLVDPDGRCTRKVGDPPCPNNGTQSTDLYATTPAKADETKKQAERSQAEKKKETREQDKREQERAEALPENRARKAGEKQKQAERQAELVGAWNRESQRTGDQRSFGTWYFDRMLETGEEPFVLRAYDQLLGANSPLSAWAPGPGLNPSGGSAVDLSGHPKEVQERTQQPIPLRLPVRAGK